MLQKFKSDKSVFSISENLKVDKPQPQDNSNKKLSYDQIRDLIDKDNPKDVKLNKVGLKLKPKKK